MFAISLITGKTFKFVDGVWTFVCQLVRIDLKDTPVKAFARQAAKKDLLFTYTRKGDWVQAVSKATKLDILCNIIELANVHAVCPEETAYMAKSEIELNAHDEDNNGETAEEVFDSTVRMAERAMERRAYDAECAMCA